MPQYRLPREVLDKEIAALVDDNVTLKTGVILGKDSSLEDLFEQGHKAVFLALGARRSRVGMVSEEGFPWRMMNAILDGSLLGCYM